MDWIKLAADVLVAGIGAFIGALIGYQKGYSELKGQHKAMAENINFLLGYAKTNAYEQEKGKQFATHEDIENVRNDIRVITHETETIKAQIGTDAWTRQMVWNQKRDAYSKILNCTTVYLDSLRNLNAYRERFWRDEKRLGITPSAMAHEPNQIEDRIHSDYVNSHRNLAFSLMEAHMFVGRGYDSLFQECIKNEWFGSAFTPDHRANLDRNESEQRDAQEKQ